MENARLTGWQMYVLTFFFTTGTTWIVLPGKIMSDAQQISWLAGIWAFAYGCAIALLWLYLAKYFPDKSLVEIAVHVLGRWAGGLIASFYILYFIQIASWVTRNLSDFMTINLMPRTPLSMFHVMVLVVCAYAVVKGIESIAMVTELLTPYIHVVFWIPLTFGVLKEWDWLNFKGDLPVQLGTIFNETKYMLGFPYMETIALMMLFPYVKKKLTTSYLMGILTAGALLALILLMSIGSLGLERSSHLLYPIFIIFRELQFTGFLEHLEAILAINILLIVCIKLSILFYCAVLAICQLCKIKKRSAVAYPLIWVLSAYALFFQSVVQNVEWVDNYLFYYYTLYGIFFPLLLIAGAWLQRKRNSRLFGERSAA